MKGGPPFKLVALPYSGRVVVTIGKVSLGSAVKTTNDAGGASECTYWRGTLSEFLYLKNK